ncbi:MAG: sodium:solute symporter [Bacteroidetes bacterium]|jgi:Na+/proline symporter|nr:sodium:solute symporter [Bacteroidota bacterium]MDF1863456.1 sodium:solute symporter [Saprospiraceae bacterium]
MHFIDWLVMLAVLLGIVAYGVWKTRSVSSVKSYLLGDRDLPWWTIGLSVMATQASAITFLSTPGQAYDDGMRFAQFYFGLPIAMVILCIFFLPIYYRLKVYTAYEYLEGRFDLKTRTFTAILFLISRGLAAGITIYAPAIILSDIMGWDLNSTILFMGVLVIFYTVAGGTKAVSVTQKQQMIIILSGMFIAAIILVFKLPADVSFGDAVGVAGSMGKLNVVDFEFDLSNRYNFWSGILGGTFLFLSYFGTDQSQVQRYLSGKSLTESRLGLLFNGIIKVPMQFLVLFVGILVFVFFQFIQPPIHYNQANLEKLKGTQYEGRLTDFEQEFDALHEEKQTKILDLVAANRSENETAIEAAKLEVQRLTDSEKTLRSNVKSLIGEQDPDADLEDNDYVFITFVTNHLPIGLVGLLLAVIFSAAMSSTASELNALATTSIIDLYKRNNKTEMSDQHYFNASRLMTVGWGLVALAFAAFASLFDNLIEAVNIVGSLFYGTILGIFMVAFFLKKVGGRAVFISAIITEIFVITVFVLDKLGHVNVAYLWLNLIGCVLVLLLSWIFQSLLKK